MKGVAAFALVLAGMSEAMWAGTVKVGPEFMVNTYTIYDQESPSIAADAAGNFVVVWASYGQDGSSSGVFGRRFDSLGIPRGPEFQVNTHTAGPQTSPAVAIDPAGNFVVAWQSAGQEGPDWGVFGQRFDSNGVPQGSEFQVNTYVAGGQGCPSIAASGQGDFVVVWESVGQDGWWSGVFGQRFNGAGVPQGSEFQINIYTTSSQGGPSVSADATGNFVVTWGSIGQDGSGTGIFGRRFDSTGVPLGAEFQINTYTEGGQVSPSVAMDPAGAFVVAWESWYQDGSHLGVFGQGFDSAGIPDGPEFRVNTHTLGTQFNPSVAIDGAGMFLVAWTNLDQPNWDWGIDGQRFDSAGVPHGSEFQISTSSTAWPAEPSITADGAGNLVAVWKSMGQDGSDWGIFGQRLYGRSPEIISPVGGDTLDCSDPRLIRPTFTWDDDGYDSFRVLIAWDSAFDKVHRVTSGRTLLRGTSWTPSAQVWRKACSRASHPSDRALYLKVYGVDEDFPEGDPARERYSPVVQVDVQP